MHRLAAIDIWGGFTRPGIRSTAQMLFGAMCAGSMILLRVAIDIRIPSASPFALMYPTVLIATLYGRVRAGLVAWFISIGWAWFFLLPFQGSLAFEFAAEWQRVALNAISSLILVILAESFRAAVAGAMAERDAEIARRVLLMKELDHRTKNNFALVVSLLELQKRREGDARVAKALELATSRIHSFASAYDNLAAIDGESEGVRMKPYMEAVVRRVSGGAFDDTIEVVLSVENYLFAREVAVAIGLFTNEALTNCAKYAFPDGRSGRIDVILTGGETCWELTITDDGIGIGSAESSSGLGTALFNAFAKQAHAVYQIDTSGIGRSLRLASC